MQFSAQTDIDAPIEFVFAALSDFDAWERLAMRRGVDLHRTDKTAGGAGNACWDLKFKFRGKPRELSVRLLEQITNAKLGFSGDGRMLQGVMTADVVQLSPKRTRLKLSTELSARTLGGRLFLQSARLGRGRIQTKINNRLSQFGLDLEQRYLMPAR